MPGSVPTAATESLNASGDSRAGVASVIGACRSTAIRLLDADAGQRRRLNCLRRNDYSNAQLLLTLEDRKPLDLSTNKAKQGYERHRAG